MIRVSAAGVAAWLFMLAGAGFLFSGAQSRDPFVICCGVVELLGGAFLLRVGRRG